MGVDKLWNVLKPAGQSRSFKSLVVSDGFESNASGKRGLRVGIDCSLWYQQVATAGGHDKGENPLVRGLFFKVKDLARLPVIPVFIFDGGERPKVKRGSKMGKTGSHPLNQKMIEILEAFGMEWRKARGEAEAELAFLNRTGVIDAIITDDCDAFVFGARTVMKNLSDGLSGNKSNPTLDLNGNSSRFHCMIYRAEDIEANPRVGLTRGGMIFYALLTGGDYDNGVCGISEIVAHGLARCGFGDTLLLAYNNRFDQSLHVFIEGWRQAINQELRTNSRGLLPRNKPGLSVPPDFPNLEVLKLYVDPLTSQSGGHGGVHLRDNKQMDLARIAALCENYFEWGTRSVILKRFRKFGVWEAAIMTILRRAALDEDEKEVNDRFTAGIQNNHVRGVKRAPNHIFSGVDVSLIKKYLDKNMDDYLAQAFVNRGPQPQTTQTDKTPLIKVLKKETPHVSTDFMQEYKIEVDPEDFVELTLSGIKGKRPESHVVTGDETETEEENEAHSNSQSKGKTKKSKKKVPNPFDPYTMKCPASILMNVDPLLVESFEEHIRDKERKKQDAENARAEKARDRERKKQEKAIAKEEKQRERERKRKEKKEEAAMKKSKGKGKGKRKATTPDSDGSSDESSGSSLPSPQKKRKTNKKTPAAITTADNRSGSTISRTSSGLMPFPLRRSPSLDFPSSLPPSSPLTSPTRMSYGESTAPSSYAQPGPSHRGVGEYHHSQDVDEEVMNIDEDDDVDLREGFRFTLPESDNPDHLEREDLNERYRKDLPTQATWSEVEPAINTAGDPPDEDEDMMFKDDILDKRHQASFMSQAHSVRKASKPTPALPKASAPGRSEKSSNISGSSSQSAKRLVRLTPAPTKRPSATPDAISASKSAPETASSSRTTVAPGRPSNSSATRRHSSPLFTLEPDSLLRPSTPPFPDSITAMEPQSSLFLPSPSPIPQLTHRFERHSSATSTQSTNPSQAIELDSDEDNARRQESAASTSGSLNTDHLQRLHAKRTRKSSSRPSTRNMNSDVPLIDLSEDD